MAGATNLAQNCIFWGNDSPEGPEMSLISTDIFTRTSVEYCALEDGANSVFVGAGCYLDWGHGMQTADPLFTSGPFGEYYLSSPAAGGSADVSSCIDTGSDASDAICFPAVDPGLCLDDMSTASDGAPDDGQADIGFHYSILTGTLDCCLALERPGDDPPSASWRLPVTVSVCGGSVWAEYSTVTDVWGCVQLTAVAGTYDLLFKGSHTTATRYGSVTLAPGGTAVIDSALLREGDADGDNIVNSMDFFVLRATYNLSAGDPDYDSRGDFNGDDAVTSSDFFLLHGNYNSQGESCP